MTKKIHDLMPLVGLMLFHTIVHGLSSSGAVNTYVTACTPLTWQLCLSGTAAVFVWAVTVQHQHLLCVTVVCVCLRPQVWLAIPGNSFSWKLS